MVSAMWRLLWTSALLVVSSTLACSNHKIMLLSGHSSQAAWAAFFLSIKGFWKYEYLGHRPSLNTT